MPADLTTSYLGLELRSPIVASASPLTGDLDALVALEEAGVAAVVLPSLFAEQIEHDAGADLARLDYLPELSHVPRATERALAHLHAAAAELSIPVVASLNSSTTGDWARHAELVQAAGAAAIELNVYAVETDPYVSGAGIEDELMRIVAQVRERVTLPVAVKLSPFYTSVANVAARLADAGASGLVLFNRFLQPDIDLETMTIHPELRLSGPDELRLPLRWVAILHGRVAVDLGATGGVRTADDMVKLLLAGADTVMITSELLRRGPALVPELERGLERWLDAHGHPTVAQARGILSQMSCGDPRAFERAQYVLAVSGQGRSTARR